MFLLKKKSNKESTPEMVKELSEDESATRTIAHQQNERRKTGITAMSKEAWKSFAANSLASQELETRDRRNPQKQRTPK